MSDVANEVDMEPDGQEHDYAKHGDDESRTPGATLPETDASDTDHDAKHGLDPWTDLESERVRPAGMHRLLKKGEWDESAHPAHKESDAGSGPKPTQGIGS